MNNIRHIPVPAKLSDISARDFNAIVDACNRFNRLRVTPGELSLTSTQVGTEIGLHPEVRRRLKQSPPVQVEVVAIVERPTEESRSLRVRAVKYAGQLASLPGEPSLYAFDGEAYDALPFFGRFAEDYAGTELLGDPKPGDTFYYAISIGDIAVVGDTRGSGAEYGTFSIVAEHADTLSCRRIASDGSVSEDVTILAKPWLLRRSPFDGKTYKNSTYTYESGSTRVRQFSDSPGITEREIVLPTYGVADWLSASRVGPATMIEGVVWADLNDSGRKWARSFAQ